MAKTLWSLTLLHSEWPKLYWVLAVLVAVGLIGYKTRFFSLPERSQKWSVKMLSSWSEYLVVPYALRHFYSRDFSIIICVTFQQSQVNFVSSLADHADSQKPYPGSLLSILLSKRTLLSFMFYPSSLLSIPLSKRSLLAFMFYSCSLLSILLSMRSFCIIHILSHFTFVYLVTQEIIFILHVLSQFTFIYPVFSKRSMFIIYI